MTRTRFEASLEKREAVKADEANGFVADSMEVRMELVRRMHSGELTLAQVQAELKRVQRGAKAAGQVSRAQSFNRG